MTHTVAHGVPVLDDALAWVACELVELLPGGDHTIGIGSVIAGAASGGEPLVFLRGRYVGVQLERPRGTPRGSGH